MTTPAEHVTEPEPAEPNGAPDDWYDDGDEWADSPCSWPIEEDS